MTTLNEVILPAEQLEGTEATLSQWLFAVGDAVKEGEPIVELETDKVAIEVVAPCDGVLLELLVKEGEKVDPDGIMAKIQSEGGDALVGLVDDAQTSTPSSTLSPSVSPTPSPAPRLASVTSASIPSGRANTGPGDCRHLMGPAVRKLVAENLLDIKHIQGTGRGGRITREDVLQYLEASPQAASTAPVATVTQASAGQQAATHTTGAMPSRLVPHNSMRRSIAKHMVESLMEKAPHVTSVFEMDMSNIIEHRKWHKKEFADQGVKLTFTAYFLAASAAAMAAVPEMNAQFHEDALEIFESINIGVGTALADKGLVVPVVKDVQAQNLFEIAKALDEQTQRARIGRLTPADMKGGTFTISNHGVSGSLMAAPIIINQPQVAILGVGKMEKRVEVVTINEQDEMRIRPKCYVSLSIDHRAVDAHQTNAWLSAFVAEIENWGGVAL